MLTQNRVIITPEIKKQFLDEVYIEKIDDVLAEYVSLFCKYPSTRYDEELKTYYANLSILIKNIRFGTKKYRRTDVDNYLQKAHEAKIQAEVFA